MDLPKPFSVKLKRYDDPEIEKTFYFNPFFSGNELRYSVVINNEEFREISLRKDEQGHWKIQAQRLPNWVGDMELDFHDSIEESLGHSL